MSVKSSISLTEAQDAFARRLVAEGHYPSLSAVLQRGVELLRDEAAEKEADRAALKELLDRRRKGPFISMEESRERLEEMFTRRRKELGL